MNLMVKGNYPPLLDRLKVYYRVCVLDRSNHQQVMYGLERNDQTVLANLQVHDIIAISEPVTDRQLMLLVKLRKHVALLGESWNLSYDIMSSFSVVDAGKQALLPYQDLLNGAFVAERGGCMVLSSSVKNLSGLIASIVVRRDVLTLDVDLHNILCVCDGLRERTAQLDVTAVMIDRPCKSVGERNGQRVYQGLGPKDWQDLKNALSGNGMPPFVICCYVQEVSKPDWAVKNGLYVVNQVNQLLLEVM